MAPAAENAALIVVGSGSIFTAILSTWLVLAPPSLGPTTVTVDTKDSKAKTTKAAKEKSKDDEKDDEDKAGDKTIKASKPIVTPPSIVAPKIPTGGLSPSATDEGDKGIKDILRPKTVDRAIDTKPKGGRKGKRGGGDTDGPAAGDTPPGQPVGLPPAPTPEEKPE